MILWPCHCWALLCPLCVLGGVQGNQETFDKRFNRICIRISIEGLLAAKVRKLGKRGGERDVHFVRILIKLAATSSPCCHGSPAKGNRPKGKVIVIAANLGLILSRFNKPLAKWYSTRLGARKFRTNLVTIGESKSQSGRQLLHSL